MQTLAEFFRQEYAPTFLKTRDPRTVAEYRRSVDLLEQICDSPTIQDVNLYGKHFIREMEERGYPATTIAKHCRHLNAIFRKLGPPGHNNGDALRRLKYTPYFPAPRVRKAVPRLFTDHEFQALWNGFRGDLDFPKYLSRRHRGKFWQAIMCFVSIAAVRREVVVNITWNDINPKELYLAVRPEIDKKEQVRYKPITLQLLEQLQELKALGTVTGPKRHNVFPWVHGEKAWYETWNRAESAAGVKVGLHDLKRFSGELALRAGASVLELQQHMDHANIRTTLDHYCRPQTRELVGRIIVPIPNDDVGGGDFGTAVGDFEVRIKDAERKLDELRLQKLLGGGVDVEKLAAVIRGEAWVTKGGTVLSIHAPEEEGGAA